MEGVHLRRSVRRAPLGVAALLAALALCGAWASSALAGSHFMGDDSVDSGEIRYEDVTTYDGARTNAISVWNALGSIDILPDDAGHICDLEIRDVNSPSYTWQGHWRTRVGADELRMNTYRLNLVTPSSERSETIRKVMAHEFGHALGLGQHEDISWHYTSLMFHQTCNDCNHIQSPLAHDRTDYYTLWP